MNDPLSIVLEADPVQQLGLLVVVAGAVCGVVLCPALVLALLWSGLLSAVRWTAHQVSELRRGWHDGRPDKGDES